MNKVKEALKGVCRKILPGNCKRYFHAFAVPPFITVSSKKELKKYRNKYLGKRCFIIGNGPSLSASDLDLIKNEYSFAANRIYHMFDKTEWRPTFYCNQDVNVLVEMGNEFLAVCESVEAIFLRMASYSAIKERNFEIPKLIWVPIYEKYGKNGEMYFSQNAKKYIYDGWTVTYMSMQLAVYMGFSEIYLLGVDHNFPFQMTRDGVLKVIDKNIPAHFYETAKDNEGENAHLRRANQYETVTKAYETAEEYSRKVKNFKIYNATRGGKLEVFERVNLIDLFSR